GHAADGVEADLERVDVVGVHQDEACGGGAGSELFLDGGGAAAGQGGQVVVFGGDGFAAAGLQELIARGTELLPARRLQVHTVQTCVHHDGKTRQLWLRSLPRMILPGTGCEWNN